MNHIIERTKPLENEIDIFEFIEKKFDEYETYHEYNFLHSVEYVFDIEESPHDRYIFDNALSDNWYQIDTLYDQETFGMWCNPYLNLNLYFIDTEICLRLFKNKKYFIKHLKKLMQDDEMKAKIDNHDGSFYDLVKM